MPKTPMKSPMMMADGGSAIGTPPPIGGGGAMPPDPSAAPPDPTQGGAAGAPTAPSPEALHYHDDAQNCQACQYMADGGQCSVLQMQVAPEGSCNAFQAKGGGDADDLGMMPGEDQGGGGQGPSGSFGTSQ
jgi:hypothetical protein